MQFRIWQQRHNISALHASLYRGTRQCLEGHIFLPAVQHGTKRFRLVVRTPDRPIAISFPNARSICSLCFINFNSNFTCLIILWYISAYAQKHNLDLREGCLVLQFIHSFPYRSLPNCHSVSYSFYSFTNGFISLYTSFICGQLSVSDIRKPAIKCSFIFLGYFPTMCYS